MSCDTIDMTIDNTGTDLNAGQYCVRNKKRGELDGFGRENNRILQRN